MRATALLIFAGSLAGMIGCGPSARNGGPVTVDQVHAIEFLPDTTALNWDDKPGPDGVRARLMLYERGQDLPVTGKGSVQVFLYEGAVGLSEVQASRPFYEWKFSPDELKALLGRNQFGFYGYRLPLAWGNHIPNTHSITLLARYINPDGSVIQYPPTSIVVGDR